jgi:enterochelin esterase-like enzyme
LDADNVTHAPKFTAIAGSSLGGLNAADAALRHPEIFGKIIAQSGSFVVAGSKHQDPL